MEIGLPRYILKHKPSCYKPTKELPSSITPRTQDTFQTQTTKLHKTQKLPRLIVPSTQATSSNQIPHITSVHKLRTHLPGHISRYKPPESTPYLRAQTPHQSPIPYSQVQTIKCHTLPTPQTPYLPPRPLKHKPPSHPHYSPPTPHLPPRTNLHTRVTKSHILPQSPSFLLLLPPLPPSFPFPYKGNP